MGGCRVLRLAEWRLRPFQRYLILHFPLRVLLRNLAEFDKIELHVRVVTTEFNYLFHVYNSLVPIVKLSLPCVTQPTLHFV